MLKKIVYIVSAMFVISLLTFTLIKLSSANPEESYLRAASIPLTPASIAKARIDLGLDKNIVEQYFTWLFKALQGDFGNSYLYKYSVVSLLTSRMLATGYLALVSFIFIVVVSIPIGMLSALKKDSFFDKVVQMLCFTSVSVPSFWFGYLLMMFFAVYLKWVPVSGQDMNTSIILPSITVSIPLIGQYIALVRKSAIEELKSVHVENAYLRGVSQRYIIQNHLLRNILPAIVTGLSFTFVYLMTGALIVEEVFAWNGIGRLFVKAIQTQDLPIIQAGMLLFGILFLCSNFFVQQVSVWIDPRQRREKR